MRLRFIGRITATAAVCGAAALGAAGTASAAPPWLSPFELAPPTPSFGVGNPQVGMGSDGTTVVAFQRREGDVSRIYAAVRPPGGTFGPAVPLSDGGVSASGADVAVDPQGNATVAWVRGAVVQARFRPAGGDFGITTPLSSADAQAPSVNAGPGGGAVVAFSAGTGTAERVQVAVKRPGQPGFDSSTPASPTTNSTPSAVFSTPQAAIDAAGNVTALWQRQVDYSGTARYVIETAIKPAASATFPTAATSDPRSSTTVGGAGSGTFDVQMTPGGRIFAIWDYFDGVTSLVQYADRAAGAASWGPTEPLAGGGAFTARAAMADDGTVAVAFSADLKVHTSVRPPGGAFSTPKAVSGTAASATQTSIALSPSGEAVVAWTTSAGEDYSLFAVRRRPGAENFGEVNRVVAGTPTTVRWGIPDVAIDDEGNAFAAMSRTDVGTPTSYSAHAIPFDVAAPTVVDVAVPAAVQAGSAAPMSASTADRIGPATLAWEFGDGTTGSGPSVTHAYATPGVYTVKVTATDAAGNRTDATRQIQVVPAPTGLPPVQPGALDTDGDGSPVPADCNDKDPKVRPGAVEVLGNAVDENCDGKAERYPVVGATATLSSKRLSSGRTRITGLSVRGVKRGDVVALSCATKARGCRKAATRKVTIGKGTSVSFTKQVRGMTLAAKAKLVVKVTRRGAAAKVVTWTMVRRKAPAKGTRCQDPGASGTRACG